MIYINMIAAGDVNIVRSSATVHDEMSEFVSQHGVCRMKLGYASAIRPNPRLAARIRNISLRVNTINGRVLGPPNQFKALKVFAGSQIARGVCAVTFECYPVTFMMVAYEVLRALEKLTGFEKVIIKIKLHCHDNGEPWYQYLDDCDAQMICGRIYHSYRKAMEDLEPTLGAVDWDGDIFPGEMVFYPRGAPGGFVRRSPRVRDLLSADDLFVVPRSA